MLNTKLATQVGKLAVPTGSALVVSLTVDSISVTATVVALPYLLGMVFIVSVAYVAGEYFKSRR